jgi:hypothetical protein
LELASKRTGPKINPNLIQNKFACEQAPTTPTIP